MFRFSTTILAIAITVSLAGQSFGQLHSGDIFLDVHDGRIVTGAIDENSQPVFGERVFGAVFGDSGFDGFTSGPGFDTFAGTFPVGTAVGFNVLTGWKVWTGDGFEPADGEQLNISFGPLNVTVADEPVEGFTINVQSNGGWHRHFNYTILGPAGENPLPGIYLLELELFSTSVSIDPSEPFWKVFNYNMPSADHEEAIAWVEENMLDEESCLGDLTGDGVVDGADLLVLLSAWGPCPGDCPPDFNEDGVVDGADLLILLSAWGACL